MYTYFTSFWQHKQVEDDSHYKAHQLKPENINSENVKFVFVAIDKWLPNFKQNDEISRLGPSNFLQRIWDTENDILSWS